MSQLWHNHQEWFLEQVALQQIADAIGTPCYVYSAKQITENFLQYQQGLHRLPHKIHYAVKANSNLAVLELLLKLGAGFDIVSQGELFRLLKIGCDPKNIVFSGVGKSIIELEQALLVGVGCINVESEQELLRLNALALRLNIKANIAIRLNPNIEINTHPYIATATSSSKFGIDLATALDLCLKIAQFSGICLKGISMHIGSQLLELEPFAIAIAKILDFYKTLQAHYISLEHINIGGGLGIDYGEGAAPKIQDYCNFIVELMKDLKLNIYIEPGRTIVANAGILLTKVEYIKKINNQKNYAIVDSGMNDLLRPALYRAWHEILPIQYQHLPPAELFDIVGPVCESGDFLAKDRYLTLTCGEILMILGAGAYGSCMSSNYNSRLRPPEIMVTAEQFKVIRLRESYQDLMKLEVV